MIEAKIRQPGLAALPPDVRKACGHPQGITFLGLRPDRLGHSPRNGQAFSRQVRDLPHIRRQSRFGLIANLLRYERTIRRRQSQ